LLDDSGAFIVIKPQESKKRGQQQKIEGIKLYLNQIIRAVPEAEL